METKEVTLFDSSTGKGISEEELENLLKGEDYFGNKEDEFGKLMKQLKDKHKWQYSKTIEYVKINMRPFQEKNGIKGFMDDLDLCMLIKELIKK